MRVTNGRAAGFVTLERGQLSHSRSYMAKAWGWTEKRVRGFLFRLERDRQIARQTGHLQTIITICNYELYQNPLSAKGQQTGRQRARKGPEEEQREQSNKLIDDEGDTRARATIPLVSREARELADEIIHLVGHDPTFRPPQWCGAEMHVQKWLNEGWSPDVIRAGVHRGVGKMGQGTIGSIKRHGRHHQHWSLALASMRSAQGNVARRLKPVWRVARSNRG